MDRVIIKGVSNSIRSLANFGLKTLQPGLVQIYFIVILLGVLTLLMVI